MNEAEPSFKLVRLALSRRRLKAQLFPKIKIVPQGVGPMVIMATSGRQKSLTGITDVPTPRLT